MHLALCPGGGLSLPRRLSRVRVDRPRTGTYFLHTRGREFRFRFLHTRLQRKHGIGVAHVAMAPHAPDLRFVRRFPEEETRRPNINGPVSLLISFQNAVKTCASVK